MFRTFPPSRLIMQRFASGCGILLIANALGSHPASAWPMVPGANQPNRANRIPYLFVDTTSRGDISPSNDPTVIRTRYVKIRFELLDTMVSKSLAEPGKEAGILNLNLFKNAIYTASLERCDRISAKSYTCVGRIQREKYSEVTLSVNDNVVVGNIRLPGKSYQIRYVGQRVHAIRQIDPRKFPPEKAPQIPDPSSFAPDPRKPGGMED